MNPWQPPSGWEQADGVRAPWTIRGVLDSVSRAIQRQPLTVALALFVVPGLWMVPAHLAEALLVPVDAPAFGPGRSVRQVAVEWAGYAWESVWWAGQISAAIAAVRGQPIRWRAFVEGLARAPGLFMTLVVVLLPLEVLAFAPVMPTEEAVFVVDILCIVVVVYAGVRTLFWQSLIVDARRPFWESLATTFEWTRSNVWRLVAILLSLTIVTLPLFVVEYLMFSERFYVSFAVCGALSTLGIAAIYVEMPAPAVDDSRGAT